MNKMFIGKYLLIFLLLFTSTLSAQKNQHDENGKKHGEWRVENNRGNTKYEGQFAHGEPVGKFTHYYRNEIKKTEAVYSDSLDVVHVKEYRKSGGLMAEGRYLNKEKDSTWLYYNSNGDLIKREYYNEGTKDSTWITYYSKSGKVYEKINYHNGKEHGKWKQYFKNGNLKLETNYINGTMHGDYVIYYSSGKVYKKGKYNNGYKKGIWITKNKEGEVVKKVKWEDGHDEVLFDNIEREEEAEKGEIPEPRESIEMSPQYKK